VDVSKEDGWVWKDNHTNLYIVKSAYSKVKTRSIEVDDDLFVQLWNNKALPAALHFAWKVILNRVATCDNLITRGESVSTNVCVMCGKCEESMGHLLFNCPFAQSIWNLCNNWVGITMVHHMLVKNHFHQFCIPRLSVSGLLLYRPSGCIGMESFSGVR